MEYPIKNEIYSRLLENIDDDIGLTLPGIIYGYFYIYNDLTIFNMDNYSALIATILTIMLLRACVSDCHDSFNIIHIDGFMGLICG